MFCIDSLRWRKVGKNDRSSIGAWNNEKRTSLNVLDFLYCPTLSFSIHFNISSLLIILGPPLIKKTVYLFLLSVSNMFRSPFAYWFWFYFPRVYFSRLENDVTIYMEVMCSFVIWSICSWKSFPSWSHDKVFGYSNVEQPDLSHHWATFHIRKSESCKKKMRYKRERDGSNWKSWKKIYVDRERKKEREK